MLEFLEFKNIPDIYFYSNHTHCEKLCLVLHFFLEKKIPIKISLKQFHLHIKQVNNFVWKLPVKFYILKFQIIIKLQHHINPCIIDVLSWSYKIRMIYVYKFMLKIKKMLYKWKK